MLFAFGWEKNLNIKNLVKAMDGLVWIKEKAN